jgi:phosphoesterase RecJ-like protein
MVGNNDFQRTVELIGKSENILLTTHTKPDGDACGCIAAIYDVLTNLGKEVKRIFLSEVPQWYQFLFSEKVPVLGDGVSLEELKQDRFAEPDLIMIVDTNSYSQLPEFDEFLKLNTKPILVIDHHVTSDGLGDVELVDTTAAATALIVFDLLKYAGWQMTENIARALFVAVATDTGWFKFNNTDSRVYRTCADLIEGGASPPQLHHELYQSFSPQRFKLMTAMLNTLELHFEGRFATQYLRQADFQQTGTAYKDTENLIDECRRMSAVEAAALFVELPDGRVRCSLRGSETIDVREIAAKFGGGGHKAAAGTHLPGPIEKAKQLILAEMTEQFMRLDSK